MTYKDVTEYKEALTYTISRDGLNLESSIAEENVFIMTTKDNATDLSSRFAEFYNRLGLAWWVEIKTSLPVCIYFFGPFISQKEAEAALPGYVEDLETEQAQTIVTDVKRCKPTQLTVCDEPDVDPVIPIKINPQVH